MGSVDTFSGLNAGEPPNSDPDVTGVDTNRNVEEESTVELEEALDATRRGIRGRRAPASFASVSCVVCVLEWVVCVCE